MSPSFLVNHNRLSKSTTILLKPPDGNPALASWIFLIKSESLSISYKPFEELDQIVDPSVDSVRCVVKPGFSIVLMI
jgi:hypothetical protein